ncbi:MAG: helix-turn-helix domain-containing protein [Erythrobacter sp.]
MNDVKFYRSFTAGQPIAFGGEPSEFVASVVSGVATLTGSLEDGRTQVVGLLLPSDFMGRPGRDSIAHDVVAATDVTLCCFRKKPFEQLLIEMPHVSERLLEMALDELDAARDWMLLLGRKTAREKVASFLMLVMRRSANPEAKSLGDPSRIELPLSREVVANFLGLTIETVSRQFSGLRKDGVIDLEGARSVLIKEPHQLADLAGYDDYLT